MAACRRGICRLLYAKAAGERRRRTVDVEHFATGTGASWTSLQVVGFFVRLGGRDKERKGAWDGRVLVLGPHRVPRVDGCDAAPEDEADHGAEEIWACVHSHMQSRRTLGGASVGVGSGMRNGSTQRQLANWARPWWLRAFGVLMAAGRRCAMCAGISSSPWMPLKHATIQPGYTSSIHRKAIHAVILRRPGAKRPTECHQLSSDNNHH